MPILASPDQPILAPLTNLRGTTERSRMYRLKSILPPRDSRMHPVLQGLRSAGRTGLGGKRDVVDLGAVKGLHNEGLSG